MSHVTIILNINNNENPLSPQTPPPNFAKIFFVPRINHQSHPDDQGNKFSMMMLQTTSNNASKRVMPSPRSRGQQEHQFQWTTSATRINSSNSSVSQNNGSTTTSTMYPRIPVRIPKSRATTTIAKTLIILIPHVVTVGLVVITSLFRKDGGDEHGNNRGEGNDRKLQRLLGMVLAANLVLTYLITKEKQSQRQNLELQVADYNEYRTNLQQLEDYYQNLIQCMETKSKDQVSKIQNGDASFQEHETAGTEETEASTGEEQQTTQPNENEAVFNDCLKHGLEQEHHIYELKLQKQHCDDLKRMEVVMKEQQQHLQNEKNNFLQGHLKKEDEMKKKIVALETALLHF